MLQVLGMKRDSGELRPSLPVAATRDIIHVSRVNRDCQQVLILSITQYSVELYTKLRMSLHASPYRGG